MSENANHYTVTLSTGSLSFFEDGSASAKIRVSIRNRDKTLMAIDSLHNLDPHRFWLCDRMEIGEDSLTLHYSKPAGEIISMRSLVPRWRAEPALHVSRVLNTASQLMHIAGDLETLRPFDFFITPGQVFLARDPDGKERWMVLPLPERNTAIADILRADEECWRWLSVEALFSAVNDDRAYMVAAIIYLCLVEDLFPDKLNRGERIRRMTSGWVGNRAAAQKALQNALPPDLAKTGLELSEFIMSLLTPRVGRRLVAGDVSRQLDLFADKLSPEGLAASWENQNNVPLARGILEDFASSAPFYDVPWETLKRLRERDGDLEGAIEITMKVPSMISLPARLQKMISGGDNTREELKKIVSVAKKEADRRYAKKGVGQPITTVKNNAEIDFENNRLGEEEYLYLAYVNGRYLFEHDEAIEWLDRDFYISWSGVVSSILTSRFLAERAKWIAVAVNCRKGRKSISQLPNTGGQRGAYAMAYLDLLDGIANVCEVVQNGTSEEFLKNAFQHFETAWLSQQKAEADDLNEPLIFWLRQLKSRAGRSVKLETLCLGIEAFLQILGVNPTQEPSEEQREIPWFDESRIFIQNG